MSFVPSNHAYHPLPPSPGSCRQCGCRLATRGDTLTCPSCGLPHEREEVERPARRPAIMEKRLVGQEPIKVILPEPEPTPPAERTRRRREGP